MRLITISRHLARQAAPFLLGVPLFLSLLSPSALAAATSTLFFAGVSPAASAGASRLAPAFYSTSAGMSPAVMGTNPSSLLLPSPSFVTAPREVPGSDSITFRILDVGQGDATLITTPSGRHILIDAGPSPDGVADRLEALGVRALVLVIATHQHADHIGGMAEVLRRFGVGLYVDNGSSHPTKTAREVLSVAAARGIPRKVVRRETLKIDGVLVTLYPGVEIRKASENDKSIGIHVVFGQSTAFIAGDGEALAREAWEKAGLSGPVDLLRTSHHGASNGTDIRFLRRLRPKWAAISSGAGNSYGHPHERALRYLLTSRAAVYRTDLQGELVFVASKDGKWLLPEGGSE